MVLWSCACYHCGSMVSHQQVGIKAGTASTGGTRKFKICTQNSTANKIFSYYCGSMVSHQQDGIKVGTASTGGTSKFTHLHSKFHSKQDIQLEAKSWGTREQKTFNSSAYQVLWKPKTCFVYSFWSYFLIFVVVELLCICNPKPHHNKI